MTEQMVLLEQQEMTEQMAQQVLLEQQEMTEQMELQEQQELMV